MWPTNNEAGVALFFILHAATTLEVALKKKWIYSTREACQAQQKATGGCLSPRWLSPGNWN